MNYLPITAHNREQVNAFIEQYWFSTQIIIRGEIVDMTAVEGVAVMEGDEIVGLVTYRVKDGACEITSLDSLQEGQGLGTALLEQVISIAREKNCHKVSLITTNDNIHAIQFYQKRGLDLVKLHHDSIKQARVLKPEIPLIGQNGIPIRHELEFEMIFEI